MLKLWKNVNLFTKVLNLQKQQIQQPARTTFILKRKCEPPLHKAKQRPKKMRGRHFIYELVSDTLVIKQKDIEVVLTTFVEGIGDRGDVVSLKPTYAYNKLLLPGLAVYKTPENIAKYAKKEDDHFVELHSSPFALKTVKYLENFLLAVVMNKQEKWKIEPWHIKASLRKAGVICNENCITLPKEPIEGPDLLKENKEFYCTITINNLENVRVKCRIHHWSTDPSERLPHVFEYWKIPSEPLCGHYDNVGKTDDVKVES